MKDSVDLTVTDPEQERQIVAALHKVRNLVVFGGPCFLEVVFGLNEERQNLTAVVGVYLDFWSTIRSNFLQQHNTCYILAFRDAPLLFGFY